MFFYFYVHLCSACTYVCACMLIYCVYSVCEGQKREPNPLGQELHKGVSLHLVLGLELGLKKEQTVL